MSVTEESPLHQLAAGQPYFTVPSEIFDRDPAHRAADQAAVKALAQAAVNVELFTIPIYMCAMTSLQGTHEINAKGISYYKGRTWPGSSTSARVDDANARAYNAVFAVFIEEMLHLQLASNIASGVGVTPIFTSPLLQTPTYGWTCYSPTAVEIPHIVKTTDLIAPYDRLRINLDGLTKSQLELFTVIEEPHKTAVNKIDPTKREDYFPAVPFANWTASSTEADLPLFGTIGYMYWSYMLYMHIRYTDGTTLFESMYNPSSVQRDLFNASGGGRLPEYPHMPASIRAGANAQEALNACIEMMLAISDQGEGFSNHPHVQPQFRADDNALQNNYPSYQADGTKAPISSTLVARGGNNSSHSHFEIYEQLLAISDQIVTFEKWFAQGNAWTEGDLKNGSGWSTLIPDPKSVADALNEIHNNASTYQPMLDAVATGAIAGVTTVLNDYWSGKTDTFPFPSMSGSGDRMALCWAALGTAPNLSQGVQPPQTGVLYNACQGLNLAGHPSQSCATLAVAHTCAGSNACMAQGGCGFVQAGSCGGSCGSTAVQATGTIYSAPSDNKCKTFGGCAVPISASQLYPSEGTMQLYDFKNESGTYTPVKLDETIDYAFGSSVYDTAWEAYSKVLQSRKDAPGPKPMPSTLRIALSPST